MIRRDNSFFNYTKSCRESVLAWNISNIFPNNFLAPINIFSEFHLRCRIASRSSHRISVTVVWNLNVSINLSKIPECEIYERLSRASTVVTMSMCSSGFRCYVVLWEVTKYKSKLPHNTGDCEPPNYAMFPGLLSLQPYFFWGPHPVIHSIGLSLRMRPIIRLVNDNQ